MQRHMAILGFELEEIVRLIRMLEESGLDEIVFKEESRYLRVRGPRAVGSVAATPAHKSTPTYHPPRSLPPVPEAQGLAEDEIALESPMMGMFYRSEKPGGPPLVTIGQAVSVGQPVGIIEAMKIFSEVLAEHAGVVVSVPATDGELVHPGAPLVILRTY
jgi:acetyl-CoA carboxylase biotin carboxyl carrier protein